MTYNKYREFVIYEIENGWILRTVPKDDPTKIDQPDFISKYCKDEKDLLKTLEEVLKTWQQKMSIKENP